MRPRISTTLFARLAGGDRPPRSRFPRERVGSGLARWLGCVIGAALLWTAAPAAAQTPVFPDTGWLTVIQNGSDAWDIVGDGQTERDIVGDASTPSGYIYADANFLYFRVRLDITPYQAGTDLRPFGWGVELDTDGNLDTYEFLMMVDGIANPDVVTLQQNTVQGSAGDPNDAAEVTLATYSTATHVRVMAAGSSFGGTPDYFLDWAVARADLLAAGITDDTPLRLVFGTSNNARSLANDLMSSTGATTLAQLFTEPVACGPTGCEECTSDADGDGVCDAIDNCPTISNASQTDTNNDGRGDACESTPPVVNAPIVVGATTVSGTSVEADGSTLEVFVDRGSGFVSEGTTTVSGGTWAKAVAVLASGDQVKARVTGLVGATSKYQSDDSNVVTVGERTAQPTVDSPLVEGATSVSGTTPDGGVVEVFADGSSLGLAVVNGTSWTLSGIDPALAAGQVITAVATAAPKAESLPSAGVTVLAKTAPPVVASPLVEGATTVAGTSEADAQVQVYADGSPIGTVTASGTSWTLTGIDPSLAAGQVITAVATASGKAVSDPSVGVTVLARTTRPVVAAPIAAGATSVSGTSSEADGTLVEVFVGGASVGTNAVASGAWTLSGLTALEVGQVVTAVATAPGKAPSDPSEPVTVVAKTAAPVVASPLAAGATSVSGTSSEADGTLVEVFVNGASVGTATAAGGVWTLGGLTALEVGQMVTAVATASGKAPSDPSEPVTVLAKTATPLVGSPLAAGATSVSGTSEANATVQVFVDGSPVGTTTASATGSWTATGLTPLAVGQQVTAVATAEGKAPSDPSEPVTVLAKTATPAVAAPIAVGATSVSGTSSEADGTLIEVFVDGASVGTNTVATGAWTLSGLTALTLGQQVTAVATAEGKAPSDPSAPVTVVARTVAPVVGAPIAAGATSVSGTSSEADGTLIEVFVDGASVGTNTVASGAWSLSDLTALAAGQVVTAVATAPGKAPSAPSEPVTVLVKTSVPAIATPLADAATSVSGTSEPNATVQVYVNGSLVGTATADANGAWVLTGLTPLTVGQQLTAVATAEGKAPSDPSAPVTVLARTTAPVVSSPIAAGATTVSGTSTEADGTTVEVFVDGSSVGSNTVASGSWTLSGLTALSVGQQVTAVATAVGKPPSDPSVPVTVLAKTDKPLVAAPLAAGATTVSGTAEPNARVEVFVGGAAVGTVTASVTGAWILSGIPALVLGQEVTAVATAEGKAPSDPAEPVTVVARSESPVVASGLVEGATSISGTAEANATVEVFVDGSLVGTVVADGSGGWTLAGLAGLVADQQVTAVATAPGKAPSEPSAPVAVLAKSEAPVVSSPLVEGATTVTGTSTEADGTVIEVFVDGASVGTNTVATGAWTLSGLAALGAGQQVTAIATAPGKGPSDPSSAVTVLAKTPSPTVSSDLAPGSTTITGTAEPGAVVEVFVNGSSVGTTTAGTDGSWSLSGIGPLLGGDSITAVATAPDKGASDPSAAVVVPTRTDRPVVSVPVDHGATSLSGSSTEADGTVIEVFVNGSSVGSNIVASGAWTLTLAVPLVAGQEVRAQATASGELPSLLSFPVIVRDITQRPTIASPLFGGDTVVRGTSLEQDGTVVEVFVNGQSVGTTPVGSGAWSLSVPNGLAAGDVVTARATAPGEAPSPLSSPVTAAASTEQVSAAPTITAPVREGATSVSGSTSEADGTVIRLFADAQLVGSVTAAGGAWTVTGLAPLAAGQILTATATAPGKGTSAPSLAVPVEGATPAPIVSSPILAGATSVSGTSVAPDGTVVEVFVNGQSVGTTTVSGGTWTLGGLTALLGGDLVGAIATTPGRDPSGVGNVVTVAAGAEDVSATPIITGPLSPGATGVSGTSTEPDGTVIQVFVDGVPAATTTVAGGTWTVSGLPPLANGSVVTATATAPQKGTSAPATSVVVGAISAPPTVLSPLIAGDTVIRGRSTEAVGTAIEVRVDGAAVGTSTVLADGSWTFTTSSGLMLGQRVRARASAAGKAPSPEGNEVIVTAATAAQTAAPQVGAGLETGDTSVSGTSSEADGTLIEVYVDGVLAGRATVAGGTWSAIVPALAGGQVVTAVATADGKQASQPSAGVTVRGRTTPPVLGAPIESGATSVSGTSSEAAGTLVDVYVNGGRLGTTTVQADGTWTLSGLPALSTGDTVEAVATAAGKAPSAPSNSVVVSPLPERSEAPTVDGPILAGATTVSGSSSEAPGSRVDVFVDGSFVGSTTVNPDGTWSVGGLPPLSPGAEVTATVTAPGEGTSEPSVQTVTTRSAAPAITGTLGEGATTVSGTSTEAPGTQITVYVDGQVVGTATVQAGGTWEATVPALAAGATVTAVAAAPDKAPSDPSAPATVLPRTTPPVIQEPLAHGDTTIRGTVEQANAVVTVYVNGQLRGTVTAAGNTWTLSGITAVVAGDVVTARALAPGRVLSDLSAPVTVLGRTRAPVVVGPVVEGETSVSGTSPDGGVIEVYVDGTLVGTVQATGTTWSLDGVGPFAVGQSVTAVARAAPLGTSSPSEPVVVIRRSAPPTIDPLGDGDQTVTGTSAEPDGTVVIVSVDGVPVASATVTDGKWSADVPPLAEGSNVTATAHAPGAGTSLPSEPETVRRRTEAPSIEGPVLLGEGRVVGTSNEPPGTEIEVRVNGEPVGTTTVQGDGTWSVPVSGLQPGDEITAIATAEGAAPSQPSLPWHAGEIESVDDLPFRVTGGGCNAAGGGPGAGAGLLLLLLLGTALVLRRRGATEEGRPARRAPGRAGARKR